jgi:exodeoxyribonuclease VII small subunit
VMTPHNEPDLTFEQAMQRLEEIVERLETGVHALPLDEIVRLYEEGQRLRQFCEQYLAEAEQRITLIDRAGDGSLRIERLAEQQFDAAETQSDTQNPASTVQAVDADLDEATWEVFIEEDFEVAGDPHMEEEIPTDAPLLEEDFEVEDDPFEEME